MKKKYTKTDSSFIILLLLLLYNIETQPSRDNKKQTEMCIPLIYFAALSSRQTCFIETRKKFSLSLLLETHREIKVDDLYTTHIWFFEISTRYTIFIFHFVLLNPK